MMVKTNSYSDRLARALDAVAQISHPDYTYMPIVPTEAMVKAGVLTSGLTPEELRSLYTTLLLAWTKQEEREEN